MSEIFWDLSPQETIIVIETSKPVMFNQDNTESFETQPADAKPAENVLELSDPAALATIGAVAVVALAPAFIHARHQRMRNRAS